MAAVIGDEMVEGIAPEPTRRANAGWRRLPIWRWVILLVVGAYFIIPLVAALRFTGFSAFPAVFDQEGFSAAFELSVRLALITTVATLVLMPPTTIYVHLRMPRLRRLMEGVTILPIVIPPVVLIVGVLQVAPGFLKGTPYLLALEYVVLAMPFAYRAFDAGLRRSTCRRWSRPHIRWARAGERPRGSCSSTSRCPPSTRRCAFSCGSRSARCSSGWAPPPCSSRTTRRKRCPWLTASAS